MYYLVELVPSSYFRTYEEWKEYYWTSEYCKSYVNPPSGPIYFKHVWARQGGGGQVDRDGGLIWEEGLNKFSQDDGIKIPKKLECKVNELFMRSWRSLQAENQKQIWTSTDVLSSHYEGRM